MSVTDVEAPEMAVGSFENPADERVYGMKVAVVSARGSFGIVRGVAVTYGAYVSRALIDLKVEVAKHVGTLTEGTYWSQHVYEGLPWYVAQDKDAREKSNGIWLWKWKPRYEPGDLCAKFDAWDYRLDYGDQRWTACTEPTPTKLADLPRGM